MVIKVLKSQQNQCTGPSIKLETKSNVNHTLCWFNLHRRFISKKLVHPTCFFVFLVGGGVGVFNELLYKTSAHHT